MGNKRRYHKKAFSSGRMIVRKFEKNLTIGALLGDVVIGGEIFDDALTQNEYFISADVFLMKTGGTAGEGPLQVGVAHNNYTVTEILENLVNDASANENDMTAQEIARRRIRSWGMFPGINPDEVLNDGKTMRVRIKFRVGDGGNLVLWVMNNSGATLTTGAKVRLFGTVYSRKN